MSDLKSFLLEIDKLLSEKKKLIENEKYELELKLKQVGIENQEVKETAQDESQEFIALSDTSFSSTNQEDKENQENFTVNVPRKPTEVEKRNPFEFFDSLKNTDSRNIQQPAEEVVVPKRRFEKMQVSLYIRNLSGCFH